MDTQDRTFIYLDHNATTPVEPRVARAMLPYILEHFGNPSSSHRYGQRTRQAVEHARAQAAGLLGIEPGGIVFTSGGTEANNHAILGAVLAREDRGDHVVTTAVEHPAVLEVCRHLESRGVRLTVVGVDRTGRVDPQEVLAACEPRTILVSVMLANNEVGTLQPVAEIAAGARAHGIWTHADCAQAAGKIPVNMTELGVDMVSLAGHKFGAPKGVGLLALGPGIRPANLMHGAGHEQGRRPGTENVAQIVGLGLACELAAMALADAKGPPLRRWRDRLQTRLQEAFPAARIHGHLDLRLPNTLSIGFPGLLAADLMALMPEVAVSAGAA
ncbi:MAG: cysteine desulfurase family protein, partial [Solirubrobacteraceae bacterium]|nr:cysteine desulfurase family protein [Solirubrobacteraceae bacterium]